MSADVVVDREGGFGHLFVLTFDQDRVASGKDMDHDQQTEYDDQDRGEHMEGTVSRISLFHGEHLLQYAVVFSIL